MPSGDVTWLTAHSGISLLHNCTKISNCFTVIVQSVLPWPPRSPELTPCDLFLWGYIKDRAYVPPMPRDLLQLRQRIVEAVVAVDRQMLQRVLQELDYRIDICRVTKGAHIEHL